MACALWPAYPNASIRSFNHVKAYKTFLASCLAFALISAASAQTPTVIHITGSTSYRAAVYTAINNILKPGYTFAFVGMPNQLLHASQAIFTGTTRKGAYSVIIKLSFSGSIGGIDTIAADLTIGPFGTFTGGGGALVSQQRIRDPGSPCWTSRFSYRRQRDFPFRTAA